ncbi:uncharacterized protein LOC128397400 [Panonychus citri]|uniref:uncharacterized protein LOC128397400 n=1 Tax=Panonychus citri TaxID=50023 RepID=UPI002307028C|nr:uncharacterized protein LOC128397400 [Panonychus citri]
MTADDRSGPLKMILRYIRRYLNVRTRHFQNWINRTINTAIQRIEMADELRDQLEATGKRNQTFKENNERLSKEIDDLAEELEESADIIDGYTDSINSLNDRSLKTEIIEDKKYNEYLLIRLERYTGLPKDDFSERYNKWCEVKTQENERKESEETSKRARGL